MSHSCQPTCVGITGDPEAVGQRRHVAELRQQRAQSPQRPFGPVEDLLRAAVAGIGQVLDHRQGIGLVRQPLLDPDPADPGGHHQHPAIVELGDIGDPGHRADIDPLVAPAHLRSAGDEDHAELAVGIQAPLPISVR